MRAISRRAMRRRAVFSSCPVADWKRRLKSSCRVSARRRSSSSFDRSRKSLASKEITTLAPHELRLDRQLLPGEAQRVLRERLGHAGQLEHDAAGLDHRDPALRRALALPHPGLGRLLRERLVGEDVDPDLPAALDLARHRDPGSLDLAVGDPAVLERLDPVVAELHGELALGLAAATAAMHLAELGPARQQHQPLPPLSSSFVGSATCFLPTTVSGASATGASTVSTCGSIGGCSRPSADVACSSVRGFSTFSGARAPPRPRPPPGRPPPAPRWPGLPRRTGPGPSRSWPRLRAVPGGAARPPGDPRRRRGG